MLKIFGDPNKHLQLMFGCRWVIACLKVLHRLCSRSCILLRSHMPVFNPRWEEVVLEVYCFKLMVQKEKHQGNAVWYRGTGHLTSQFCTREQVTWLFSYLYVTPLCCGVGNVLDYLTGVKEVFQVEGKKDEVMFPWKTYCFPLRIFQWQQNHFIFDSIKLNISIGSLSTPEWWWYGFFLS